MTASRKFDQDTLYSLLPAVYRVRDDAEGRPLFELMGVIAEQVAIMEEDLAQLYDDQFIETCADWVVPYIGDLLGVREIHQVTTQTSKRAQVANTIAYRRRKGTAAMVEQLARDVTRWDAKVVEFFQYLATTQHMSHLRLTNRTVDLRDGAALQDINTAFDTLPHTVEIRTTGKYNIPNLGVYLWRIQVYPLTTIRPFEVDQRRYLFNPLGINTALYNLSVTEETIIHLSERSNVPAPLRRRYIDLSDYYGEGKSIAIYIEQGGASELVSLDNIRICDLSDNNGIWAHLPEDNYAVDPVLGRLALPQNQAVPDGIRVTFHYGFSDDIGGGEYGREISSPKDVPVIQTTSIQQGLDDLATQSGIVEVLGETFDDNLTINLVADQEVVLRSADKQRAYWRLPGNLMIDGAEGSSLTLDGFTLFGGQLVVRGNLSKLIIRHCTLVPGITLDNNSLPPQPITPSIVVESRQLTLNITKSIVGAIQTTIDSQTKLVNSIIDATATTLAAYTGSDDTDPGGSLHISNCTVIGKVHAVEIELATNTIFFAELADDDDWLAPVWTERRQRGCIRFSYLSLNSIVPQRYQCHPRNAQDPAYPHFTSIRYGSPHYCQLASNCHYLIVKGADDEGEMGVFHDLFQEHRLTNLRTRSREYMPFGMESVIYLAS